MPFNDINDQMTTDQFLHIAKAAKPLVYYDMQGEQIRHMQTRWIQSIFEEMDRHRITPEEIWAEILKPHARSTEVDERMQEILHQYFIQ